MEESKAREIFSNFKKYNEMVNYFYQGKNELTVTFKQEDGTTHDFDSYRDFAKFIRQVYVSEVA